MKKMVNMEFDGKAVSVPEGMTLVDAAATAGIHIPNLCHIKELRGVGACRMCMVEIEGMKAPVTACTTRTKEGMKVQTRTAKVEEIRKFVTDLVLSFHPLDCMTCPKAGSCDLQRYAADLGIRESSFGRKSFNYELNDRSPFITIDNNYCILCGRCVRVCKEQGTNVLDFMGRGITTKVSTALDKPLHESGCTFCGSCIDACPVNAIMERDRWQHGREWDLRKQETVCTACASGCSVTTSSKNGKIVKVNAKDSGYICAIGRFGFGSLNAGNRLVAPLKKQGDELVATTWEDALQIAADGLKKAGTSAGFIASGSLSNEEAFAIQLLARDVAGSANIDTTASSYASGLIAALEAVHGRSGVLIATQADLTTADCIVLVGAGPSQKQQALQELDVMIRRRGQAGAKLIIISREKTDLAGHQNSILLQPKAGAESAVISGFMHSAFAAGAVPAADGADAIKKTLLSVDDAASASGVAAEQIAAAAKVYAAARNPVIVIGAGIAASRELSTQALNLALVKNAGVLPLFVEANALGAMMMGCRPDRGPGFSAIKKAGFSYQTMRSDIKTLLVAGDVPDAGFNADFTIVLASHAGTITDKADIVLPLLSLYERRGAIVNVYGKTKIVVAAQQAVGGSKDAAEIAAELSQRMSRTRGFTVKDVAAGVNKVKTGKTAAAAFKCAAAQSLSVDLQSASVLLASMNKSMLSNSALAKIAAVADPIGQQQ
jgi:NADH dehydrogenase/NADH:ubiquinone oxidoreductase subunit G